MAKKTIKLKCFGEDIILNLDASAALNPGMILEQDTSDEVKPHAAAGGNVAPILVSMENSLEGKDINDAYASGDLVRVWAPRPGDEGYMYLEDGQDVSKHDLLESAGNGRLQKHTSDEGSIANYPKQIVAEALEAKDLTVSGSLGSAQESSAATGHQFIKVRFV